MPIATDSYVSAEGRAMATISRAGTGLLMAGGLLLALLMAYTLIFDSGLSLAPAPRPSGAAEVAVFYPNRVDWLDFRLGILECARRGLCQVIGEMGDSVLVETRDQRLPVRFTWYGTPGV